jgi:hypothetical protein
MSDIVRHTLTSNYTDTDFPFFFERSWSRAWGGFCTFRTCPAYTRTGVGRVRAGCRFFFLLCTFHTYPAYTRTGIGRVRAGCRFFLLPALFLLLPWVFRFIFFLAYIFCVTLGGMVFICYHLGFFVILNFCSLTPDWVAGHWGPVSVPGS